MFTAYPAIVRTDSQGKTTAVYFPDFHCHFEAENFNTALTFNENIRVMLLEHIAKLQGNNIAIPVPKKTRLYSDAILGENDFWTKCNLDNAFSIGLIENYLPNFGVLSSFITAITMAVITFTTVTVSSDGAGYVALGSIGAVGSMIMAVMMYYYSNASNISRIIGRKIDNTLSCTNPSSGSDLNIYQTTDEYHSRHDLETGDNIINNLCKIGVTAIPIVTTAVTSLSHFKQVASVGKKLDERKLMSEESFAVINTVMITFSLYSTLLFQVSFLPPLYRSIDNLLERLSKSFDENRDRQAEHGYSSLPDSADAEVGDVESDRASRYTA